MRRKVAIKDREGQYCLDPRGQPLGTRDSLRQNSARSTLTPTTVSPSSTSPISAKPWGSVV